MPCHTGVIKEALGEMKNDATELDVSSGRCIVMRGVELFISF